MVDDNNNPVKILARYHLKTNLLEKAEKLLWGKVKKIDFPFLRMDHFFKKLCLKIIQDAENDMENHLKPTRRGENERKSERVACIED